MPPFQNTLSAPKRWHLNYSGISIYRSRNVHFLVFTVHHLWFRIKFHINNVIYFCIHRSPTYRFSAFIACKSCSRHSICHMDFLAWFVWEKKLKRVIYVESMLHTSATRGRLYVCIQSTRTYLCYIIYASHVTFSFETSIFALFSTIMALGKKRVRTLHDWLKIIHEVEKNPGEKRVDIAKQLGLPASTLNSIFVKKNEIREQIQKCGNACKNRKTRKESTFAELEKIPDRLMC
jgi:hypothetical protein